MTALKHSRQRDLIRDLLEGRTDHPTADMVFESAKQVYPNISLGTVYRNLSLLAELGEIRKLSGIGDADRFDPRTDWHCHFVCSCCGKILDMEPAEASGRFLTETSEHFSMGEIRSCEATFRGLCRDCLPVRSPS